MKKNFSGFALVVFYGGVMVIFGAVMKVLHGLVNDISLRHDYPCAMRGLYVVWSAGLADVWFPTLAATFLVMVALNARGRFSLVAASSNSSQGDQMASVARVLGEIGLYSAAAGFLSLVLLVIIKAVYTHFKHILGGC
jgi:hypothetical protein